MDEFIAETNQLRHWWIFPAPIFYDGAQETQVSDRKYLRISRRRVDRGVTVVPHYSIGLGLWPVTPKDINSTIVTWWPRRLILTCVRTEMTYHPLDTSLAINTRQLVGLLLFSSVDRTVTHSVRLAKEGHCELFCSRCEYTTSIFVPINETNKFPKSTWTAHQDCSVDIQSPIIAYNFRGKNYILTFHVTIYSNKQQASVTSNTLTPCTYDVLLHDGRYHFVKDA